MSVSTRCRQADGTPSAIAVSRSTADEFGTVFAVLSRKSIEPLEQRRAVPELHAEIPAPPGVASIEVILLGLDFLPGLDAFCRASPSRSAV